MTQSFNGALLALGVVGAVALAGRVRRGSFAHGWHGRARELLNAAADEQYVDSGDLIEVLEAIKDDHSVTGRTRARVVSLLLGSQDEGYLDSGEAMEVIEAALGHGSRAIYVEELDAANAEYHAALQARNQNDRKRRARESGSRAQRSGAPRYVAIVTGRPLALPANVSHDYELSRQHARKTLGTEHVELMEGRELTEDRAGGSRAVGVDAHNPKSRAEYIAYLDDLAQRARDGKLTFDEDSRWSYRAGVSPYDHHTTARKLLTEAILRNVATEREWISTWPDRNPGTDRGSRAFTLDDPSRGQF
jgi:hypothetical protein